MDNNKLKLEFNRFKNIPFPEDKSNNEEIGEIHFELVQYDDYIAGIIDSIIKGEKFKKGDLYFDDELLSRINLHYDSSINIEEKNIMKSYRNYMEQIKILIQTALLDRE